MTLPRWLRAVGHVGRVREVVRSAVRVRNGPGVVARYLGLVDRYPFRFRTRTGLTVDLNTYHDLVTAWVIFCRDEYRVPPAARLIVDLGANIGLFTLRAAEVAPAAVVVAVEPFPECFRRLTEAVAANGLSGRVVAWPLAVAGVAGVRSMPAEGPSQSNGLLPIGAAAGAAVRVDAVTLAEVLARVRAHAPDRPIDLLKIDVEGAEHEFLVGLPADALAGVREVGIEYHPNGPKDTLFAALSGYGFDCLADAPAGPNSGVARFRRRPG